MDIYNDIHYSIIESSFTALKILYSLPIHPSLLTTDCFFVCFLARPHSIWDLSSQPGIEPVLPAWKRTVLTTGTAREVPFLFFWFFLEANLL